MKPDMEFLTVHEVAERLRLSSSMVYKEISSGRLPHYRFGSRLRISEEGLDEYVNNQLVEPESRRTVEPTSNLDL